MDRDLGVKNEICLVDRCVREIMSKNYGGLMVRRGRGLVVKSCEI